MTTWTLLINSSDGIDLHYVILVSFNTQITRGNGLRICIDCLLDTNAF